MDKEKANYDYSNKLNYANMNLLGVMTSKMEWF